MTIWSYCHVDDCFLWISGELPIIVSCGRLKNESKRKKKKHMIKKEMIMRMNLIFGMVLLVGVCGCETTRQTSHFRLTQSEIRELSSKNNVTLSDSLRQRLIAGTKELRLTPEEMMVLRSTGKVILCGKCGYILNSKKFKEHNAGNTHGERDSMGFVKGSLRDRIFAISID